MDLNNITGSSDVMKFDNFIPQNESQSTAKNFLEKLADFLVKEGVPTAAIIGIQGSPGLGKSHLLNAFKTTLETKENIGLSHNLNDKHFLMMEGYKGSNIILIDDLFQDLNSLDDAKGPIIERLSKLIFYVYENKKLLLITSNFDIKLILDKIGSKDEIGRLKDRITELISHTQPIKLEGESYRLKKAQNAHLESVISEIFLQVGGVLPRNKN